MMMNGNQEHRCCVYIERRVVSVSEGRESRELMGARQIHVGGAMELNFDGKELWMISFSGVEGSEGVLV